MVKALLTHINFLFLFFFASLFAFGQELDFYHYQPPKKNKLKAVKILVNNAHNKEYKILGSCNYNKKGLLIDSTDQRGNDFHFEYNKDNEITKVENRIFEKQQNQNDVIYHLKKWYKTTHDYEKGLRKTSKHYDSDTLIQIISYSYDGKKNRKYMVKDRKANLIGMGYLELDDKGNQIMEEYFNGKSQKQFNIQYRYDKKGRISFRKEQWYIPKRTSLWKKSSLEDKTFITEQYTYPTDSNNENISKTLTKKTEITFLRKKIKKEEINRWYIGNDPSDLELIQEQLFEFNKQGEKTRTTIKDYNTKTFLEGTYYYKPNALLEKIEFKDLNSTEKEFEILYQYEQY